MPRLRHCLRLALIATALCGGPALAADARHQAADGSGSCPESETPATSSPVERADEAEFDPAGAAPVPRSGKPHAPALLAPRAGGSRSAAPRWHSFLPGMFR
ncbi:hypothetical protein [Thermomonas flagellata]|uniref:hypothetical protein n=1 Tax=Thermomonas flagellata TaxID=2888524 RepID=UPI001F046C08|nr:hypothetical protein [Thermomonas flagellata]